MGKQQAAVGWASGLDFRAFFPELRKQRKVFEALEGFRGLKK